MLDNVGGGKVASLKELGKQMEKFLVNCSNLLQYFEKFVLEIVNFVDNLSKAVVKFVAK